MNKSFVDADFSVTYDFQLRRHRPAPIANWSARYVIFKAVFDKGFAIVMLPVIVGAGLVLILLNPLFNPGPLFFCQERMGLGGQKFRLWKFRTMDCRSEKVRPHDAPLEQDRITALGRFLRRTRIDELPNFFNVLRGDMSVIGPRPDAWEHAIIHMHTITNYRDRFRVRPGITGLAQVMGGYADNTRAIERKARFDLFYVKRSRIKLELFVVWRTIAVLFTGFGAR